MSLQICHCGWSKVTTYHGLRTHQGKKGCTPKGMHIPQHKLFSYLPPTLTPPSLIKIEDISSDIYRTPAKSVTTYHDLRTEQGMMGYTPQEIRVPERNQNPWSNKWEQSHPKDNWAVQSTPVKEESVFMSPNLITQMNSVLTQVPAQDMYTPMPHAERDSQQLIAKLRTSKTLEFKIGFQRDMPEISQSDLFTTQMSSAPTQISLTQSDTSFFQTPPRSQQGSAFSDKASRMLDFSFGDSKAFKNAQFLINTDTDSLSDKREKEREAERLLQATHDMMKVQLQQKIYVREQKMAEVRSAVKSCKGSLDAEWVQINTVFSEVIRAVEDAQQKALEPLEKRQKKIKREAQNLLQTLQGEIDRLKNAIDELDRSPDLQASPPPALADSEEVNNLNIDTSFSFGTLRATISTMMKEIQQHLENLSSLELKRIATFAVDVKLDSATAHQCLVLSKDGKRVQDGGEKLKSPDTPERFDLFGSVLGINSLNRGRSYWEVEVKNKTGWDLGVARRTANRKGILKVNPDNGYWVAVHFEGRKYAALTVPPTSLPLKENPQKVGVFVDYEEGVVSFYDVTKGSHIFSFTECLFRDDIFPYFSPHLKMNDKNADPLIISAV
ncbi:uncharacterized protein V3H82_014279 [Fundulus diaphanus]